MTHKVDDGLRRIIRNNIPEMHWNSIETGASEPGVPDLNGCHDGVEFWIECKWTEAIAVNMRVEQIGWLLRRARASGRCFIAVRKHAEKGVRRPGCDEFHLYQGADAAELNRQGLSMRPLLWCPGPGPGRWAWSAIREALLG